MALVEVRNDYAVSPDALWDVTTDYAKLATLNAGMVAMRNIPAGRLATGDDFTCEVSLFGLLPWQPYRIRIREVNDAGRFFLSEEDGSGVDMWRHRSSVIETEGGAALIDRIEIEAGWKTALVARWATLLYRRRHPARLRLLGLA